MPARGSKQALEKKAKPKYRKIDTTTLPPLALEQSCHSKSIYTEEVK